MNFQVSSSPIDPHVLKAQVQDRTCGACVVFEGWVRNHNEGREVLRLEYEVYEPLAMREGQRIIEEAAERFGPLYAVCVHRQGLLELEDLAVAVAVSATHRDEAFRACRYIIDEVKHRLPIWKKEHYADGDAHWVNCQRCAAHARSAERPVTGS